MSDVISALLRITDAAMVAAKKGNSWEELANAYENAVMKELADATEGGSEAQKSGERLSVSEASQNQPRKDGQDEAMDN